MKTMSRTNYSSLSHTRGVNDDEDDIIDTNQDIKLANLPPRSEASRSPSISLQRFPQLPVHKSSSPQSTSKANVTLIKKMLEAS